MIHSYMTKAFFFFLFFLIDNNPLFRLGIAGERQYCLLKVKDLCL